MERAEIAIVGGGPAGAAAAICLAEAGREVVLLERTRQAHHKFCGEFLSREVLSSLRTLGLDADDLGAVPIDRVRLSHGTTEAAAALPFAAASLSRKRLDAALLARAVEAGAVLRRGSRVTELASDKGGTRIDIDGTPRLLADKVIVATGKTDLPRRHRETPWQGRSQMIGFKMHLRLSCDAHAKLQGHTGLHLFDGGCAGLQPVENAANLCITLSRKALARAGGSFQWLLETVARSNSAFGAAIDGAECLWRQPFATARVPYGFLRPAHELGNTGCYHVGDQAAVTASFTGDGIAIALESGICAADQLLTGRSSVAYQERLLESVAPQVRAAMRLQKLIDRPRLHRSFALAARLEPRLLTIAAKRTRLRPPSNDGQAIREWS